MTRKETAAAADRMIGAAQALDAAARRLKLEARHLRVDGLHETMTTDLWMMHKESDIKRAAEAALVALGMFPADAWLVERSAQSGN
jgi:hypothetical protein